MFAYLGAFSSSFTLAVAIWPLLSALLTLPILAVMYNRYHRLRAASVITAYVCVLYALGLVTFTLYPMPDNPAQYCQTHSHSPQLNVMQFADDLRFGGTSAMLQLVFNVALFVPLGFALKRWARWRAVLVVPVGLAVSALIETSQLTGVWGIYPCAYRQFDVDDLLTNTIGAALGCFIAWMYGLLDPVKTLDNPDEINTNPALLHRCVTLVIDLVFVWVFNVALALGFIFVFQKTATPLPNGEFLFLGFNLGSNVSEVAARMTSVIAFAVFELCVPAAKHGQTLGGMFTHMTVETVPRSSGRRAAFYLARTVLLFLATQLYPTGWNKFGLLVAIVLAVFYVVARRMPYDLI